MPTGPILNQQRERWARNQSKALSATDAALSGAIVKKTSIPIAAASSALSGSLVKQTLAILSATSAALSATLVKKTTVLLSSVAAAFNGSLIKKTLAVLSATAAAFNGSLVKKTLFILSAIAAAFNGSLIKKTLVVLSATAIAFSGVIVKKTLIVLSALASAFNGTLAHARVKVLALAATMTALSGSLVKKTLVSLQAIVSSLSAVQSKRTSHSIAAVSSALSGNVNKLTRKFFQALSSAWSAVINAVKSTTPPTPTTYQPIVIGTPLRSFGVSFTNPAVITTASNDLQQFQFAGNKFLIAPGGYSLFDRPCHLVAGGNVVIPSFSTNARLNLALTLRGFSQRTQPAVVISDDVMATLTDSQPVAGTAPFQLICRLSAQQGSPLFYIGKTTGRLVVDWMIMIGGAYFSGKLLSNNNPFLEPLLQFSLGAQFTGSVSGLDNFIANLYQFETQQ